MATVWLVWREREVLRVLSFRPAALLPVAGLSLFWFLGTIADARVAVAPALVLAWSVALFGRNAAVRLAPAAATFPLAVRLWSVLVPPFRG